MFKIKSKKMAVHKKYNNGTKSNALGRGLDALISTEGVRTQGSSTINEIPLDQIEANPNQPRREFDDEALHELAESIKAIGIIQPITLRQVSENRFQIIAGERRWRASQLAGLTAIPAYIRTISDENVMEMALVENIQRQDLNAIEIALAYEHLLENEGMTQEKISERVGKSRAAIANYLRLLKLPAQVQMALQKKEIDMGHCRALLALDSPSLQIKLFKEIQKNGYSVRKVEEMVQRLKSGEDIESGKKTITAKAQMSEEFTQLKNRLSQFLNTKVQFTCSAKGKGKISIPFANEEELEHIMNVFDQSETQYITNLFSNPAASGTDGRTGTEVETKKTSDRCANHCISRLGKNSHRLDAYRTRQQQTGKPHPISKACTQKAQLGNLAT